MLRMHRGSSPTEEMVARRRRRSLIPLAALVLVGGGVACTGGGGSAGLVASMAPEPATDSFENAARSTDRARSSSDRPPNSFESEDPTNEGASGVQRVGNSTVGLDCAGKYTCVQSNKKSDQVTVTKSGTGCLWDDYLMEPDNSITRDGEVVGAWSGSASTGFSIVVPSENYAAVCVRSSATNQIPTATATVTVRPTPPPPPPPTPVRDAGV